MYDYNYGYDYIQPGINTPGIADTTGVMSDILGKIAALAMAILIISLAIAILLLISNWKIFEKAKRNGWESLVPIHNLFVLLEIADTPTWHIFLFFVPIANIYVIFRMFIDLAHKFGKPTGFGVLTVFLSVICLPILAFSKKVHYNFEERIEEYNNTIPTQTPYNEQTTSNQPDMVVSPQQVNMGVPFYNQGVNFNENVQTMNNPENINELETNFNQPIVEQQTNDMPTFVPNDINQTPMQPAYSEQSNFNQPVLEEMNTQTMNNNLENEMPIQNAEILLQPEVQSTMQEPVYQQPINEMAMNFNQPIVEQQTNDMPTFVPNDINQTPMQQSYSAQQNSNQQVLGEQIKNPYQQAMNGMQNQINNNQNGTMM